MNIGLALSGGGFRALVFHLGVLARLAEEDQLENVTYLSTVSGGSLAAGLIVAANGYTWPTSTEYLEDVLPRVRSQVTTNGLQRALLWRQLRKVLTIFETRADDVSVLIKERWGIDINLDQLPKTPRWMINATCYETGKNWRFERFRMGDYAFGYTYDVKLPLADAMAASAAFPALIGPLVLDIGTRSWFKYNDSTEELDTPEVHQQRKTRPHTPKYQEVHLWDGGVYDNLGLEGLHDFRTGWPQIDFLVVSDASGIFGDAEYKQGVPALLRMASGIMKNQIRALQSRAVLERIIDHRDSGNYLRTGNYCEAILRTAWREEIKKDPQKLEEIMRMCEGSLNEAEARYCADMGTEIGSLSNEDYEKLFQHGFDVADATFFAYNGHIFNYIGFKNTRWA